MGVAASAAGVTRRYGKGNASVEVLSDASVEIADDQLVVVLGRSGSGKTTLLSVLGGLDHPDSGSVTVAGVDLAGLSETELEAFLQRSVAWVFQTSGLLPLMTARENVALPLRAMGVEAEEAERKAGQALDVVGLGDRGDHLASELSGGEQQRVAIARAIAKEPRVLLADEPTSQLDTENGRAILKLLREVADSGTCVLIATHDTTACEFADRVIRIEEGRIQEAFSER